MADPRERPRYRVGRHFEHNIADFMRRVDESGPLPAHDPSLGRCHQWMGPTTVDGYGRLGGRGLYAHRWILEQKLGRPLRKGEEARHRCDNPTCVNPDHLEPGTHAENMGDMVERGRSRGWHGEKTHCKNGHPFSGENLYLSPKGTRGCRQCKRDQRARERRANGVPLKRPTHCGKGHEFTPENTRIKSNGRRSCRACERIYSALQWAAKKAGRA